MAGNNGGCINVETGGSITNQLDSSILSNNVSTGSGGGINVEAPNGLVDADFVKTFEIDTISNSTFNNNFSTLNGGGANLAPLQLLKMFNNTFNIGSLIKYLKFRRQKKALI